MFVVSFFALHLGQNLFIFDSAKHIADTIQKTSYSSIRNRHPEHFLQSIMKKNWIVVGIYKKVDARSKVIEETLLKRFKIKLFEMLGIEEGLLRREVFGFVTDGVMQQKRN